MSLQKIILQLGTASNLVVYHEVALKLVRNLHCDHDGHESSSSSTKKYFGTFNKKWCEGEEFGFGKVDNFTVELILLLAFFACQVLRGSID